MDKNVIVYGTPTCPYCVRVKEYLTENSIEFENVDVAEDNNRVQEMVDKSGQMGVPVIDIDGEIIVGFEKEKISQALGIS
ncbi:MAG: glutaredoxin domain-containing protein [Candidatus Tantalella remota]|nr:glutaredoxin domain-containing protein [Candidatus Tantalella remota]